MKYNLLDNIIAEMRKMNEHFQFRFSGNIQNLNCCKARHGPLPRPLPSG